jgi:histidine ammonia-lyase
VEYAVAGMRGDDGPRPRAPKEICRPAEDARRVLRHALTVLAAEFTITGAARDVLDARLARGDDALGRVTERLRHLTGPLPRPSALQPPVSFRASPQVLAHLNRAIDDLDAATERALGGVTDSPAFLDGQFVGSADFYGYDLAVHLHALTVASSPSADRTRSCLPADCGPSWTLSPKACPPASPTARSAGT